MGGRNPDGTFATGNREAKPRGRGLAALIKERTKEGLVLVERAFEIMDGKPICVTEDNPEGIRPTVKDVTWAIEWLGERGFGKPTQPLEHSGAEGEPLQIVVNTLRGEEK